MQREQFKKPLYKNQHLAFRMVDLANEIEMAKYMVYKAACDKDDHKPFSASAAKAKLIAAETAMHVTTDAVQMLGGNGFMKEYHVERLMRDAKITQIYEGTSGRDTTCAMRSIPPRSTTSWAGCRRPNLPMVSRKPSNGIWKTGNGGRLSSPVNIRIIMKKCMETGSNAENHRQPARKVRLSQEARQEESHESICNRRWRTVGT